MNTKNSIMKRNEQIYLCYYYAIVRSIRSACTIDVTAIRARDFIGGEQYDLLLEYCESTQYIQRASAKEKTSPRESK